METPRSLSSELGEPPASSRSKSRFATVKKKLSFFKKKKGRRESRASSLDSSGRDSIGEDGAEETSEAGAGGGPSASNRNSSVSSEEEDAIRCVDKFGFITEEPGIDTYSWSLHSRSSGPGSHKQKVPKSSASVASADSFGPNAKNIMKNLCRNGLPDSGIRHRAWTLITSVDHIASRKEGEYNSYVGKTKADMKQIQEFLVGGKHRTVVGQIEKDLRKTFPRHDMFRDLKEHEAGSGEYFCVDDDGSDDESMGAAVGTFSRKSRKEGQGRGMLRRILRAYSVYDSEVGYSQGMNFVAATFLMFLPEEEAFWLLVVVMNEDPYKLRDLFSRNMTATHEVLYIAENLISQFLPDLYEHLENEQVNISMFATQWLMTLFTRSFPIKLVAKVWDVFLCDGWRIVYCTMLAILDSIQEDLLKRNFEQMISFLKGFPPSVNCDLVIATASSIPLQHQHIYDHAIKFRMLRESGEMLVEEIPQSRFIRRPESVDGRSMCSLPNINKVHRFVSKLKRSTREISVQDLSDKLTPIAGEPKFAVLLANVLSVEECDGLIKRAKGEQFEDVLMRRTSSTGPNELAAAIANCRRSMVEDFDLTSELFDRVAIALQGTDLETKLQHAPWVNKENANALTATGLNDRLHFLRYGAGQFFAPHRDSRFRKGSEISHITMQVFLNHNFSGGMTSFRGGKRFLDVKPKAGSVLLFDQDLRREECEVFGGRKFIARSDIMYAPTAA
mmetsp:Transcript_45431/g.95345  ORF Transcript_45431/g.95345 Transcript_45431/m.95345 type:complete len:729 (+) Transcript_45431:77-2263(+)